MTIVILYPELLTPPSCQKINFEGTTYLRVSDEALYFYAEKIELITEEGKIVFEAKKGLIAGFAVRFELDLDGCKCVASLLYDLLKEVDETKKYRGFLDFSKNALRMLSKHCTEGNPAKSSMFKDFFFELKEVTENV